MALKVILLLPSVVFWFLLSTAPRYESGRFWMYLVLIFASLVLNFAALVTTIVLLFRRRGDSFWWLPLAANLVPLIVAFTPLGNLGN